MNPINKIRCVVALIAITAILPLLHGCASPNPNAGQVTVTTNPTTGLPQTNVAPAYLPNQTATGIINTANQVAPFVPAPWGAIATGVLALATAVTTTIAVKKNGQANAATATANQLAASIVAQGPVVTQAVSDHASNNDAVFPAVAAALNNKQV